MRYALGQRLRELRGPILLTGHTGFKGTWMTYLLEELQVPVIGYSLPAEKNSLFDRSKRIGAITEMFADIRDYNSLEKFVDTNQPSTIIHMAAQPLVMKSYFNPLETFEVNIMGTVNVLNIGFKKDYVKAILIVTTDKVYRNNDSGRTFVESDPLEGKDPYSASKVGAEAAVAAWQQIEKVYGGPKGASVRAGNVIGGGDWADNRLLPDLVKAIFFSEPTVIRNPTSTRPWQHVLDPLTGYILALESLMDSKQKTKAFNFGPVGVNLSAQDILDKIKEHGFNTDLITKADKDNNLAEAHSIALNSTLSRELLGFKSLFTQEDALFSTIKWWDSFYKGASAQELCKKEIQTYIEKVC